MRISDWSSDVCSSDLVKLAGVSHEFSTIKGIVEDVTEIVLNLKQVRFKKSGETGDLEKILVLINGQETFSAGDIGKFSSNFTVLNPELVICNMNKAVTLEVELTVSRGRGYVTAEENKQPDTVLVVIPINSIFTHIGRAHV